LLLIVSGATGAALGLATSVFVARSIIKPLSSLEETATAVSEGDLEARAEASGPRELAHLGSALNQMTESLLDASKRRELEEALRQSEERLHTVVDSTPIVMFALNREGVFTLSEGKGLEALGLKPGQVVGQTVFDVYRDVPQILKNIRRAFAGESFTATVEVGDLVFESWYSPVWDQSGEVSGVIGVATDVTERKRAEEAVRESETKFRTLAETTAAATFIYEGARIRYVNSAAEALTGYTRAEMVEMNFWDVIDPDSREFARERGLARQRGEDVPPRYEVKLVTKDGDERWVDFMAGHVEFEGKPAVLGTAFDISERKRAEEAVRESEERYRRLIDTAADIIFTVSTDGTITSLNPAVETITGWSIAEWVGKPFASLLHPDDLPTGMEGFRRTLEGGEPLAGEYRLLTKSGEFITADVRPRPLLADGTLVGVFGIAHDITNRKRAEEALRQSEEYFRSLTENASDVIMVLNDDGTVRYVSSSVKRAIGYEQEVLLGTNAFGRILHPDDMASASDAFAAAGEDTVGTVSMAVRVRHKDGSWHAFEGVLRNLLHDPVVAGFVLNCRDVTERKQAEETIRHLAYHDALTDLPNRTLFQDRLDAGRIVPGPGSFQGR
jgi:PAS domain S-box-containing protein